MIIIFGWVNPHFMHSNEDLFAAELTEESEIENQVVEHTIKKIIFEGNTAISSKELDLVVLEFIDKPINLAILQEIAQKLAEYYWQLGYKTSDAYPLTQQDLSQGVVQIRIVEGSLVEIDIEGLEHTKENYVINLLQNQIGEKPLNINRLLESIKLLQRDSRFMSVNAELLQGNTLQQSRLKLFIEEAPNITGHLFTNNHGALSSGEEQIDLELNVESLTGYSDRFSVRGIGSEGSYQIFADYQIPLNTQQSKLRIHYEGGESQVIREPFRRFDITGNYQKAWIQIRHPLLITLNREIATSVEVGWQKSQTFVLDRPFSFSSQIPDAGYEIWTIRMSSEWLESLPSRAIAGRLQLTAGWDSLSATEDPFFIGRGQFQWLEKLDSTLIFSFSLSGQISGGDFGGTLTVLPSEQFSIGGINTVPGYDLNLRRGDSGVNAIVRFHQTVIDNSDWGKVELMPFFAVGTIWNGNTQILQPETLASLGINCQWQWETWLINLGISTPLSKVSNEFTQEVYFSISNRFTL